jgi:hypothetical protein
MKFRVTYTIDRETIFTDVLETQAEDFPGVIEAATEYLEDNLTPQEFLRVQALNLLIIQEETNVQ